MAMTEAAPAKFDISDIRRNRKGEIVRVSISEFKGRHFADVRICFVPTGKQAYQATKKGCTVRVDQIDELIAALGKAKTRAREMGWIE